MNKTIDLPQETEDAWKAFCDFLVDHKQRITLKREAIFKAAFNADGHYTAEDLLVYAKEIDKSSSRATVYRTLPLLVESGAIREVDVGRDYVYYASNRNKEGFKAQVICTDCDEIYEVDAPFLEWYGKTVADRLGMEVSSQRLQVYAHCKKDCAHGNKE